jgi:CheY-like chemotaxis protein
MALQDASARKQPLHLVVTDCQMPGMDGFALTRRVKRDPQMADTRVVILTSIGRPRDAARCRQAGADASLTKPVKGSDLLDVVVTLFDGGSRTRPVRRAAARKAVRPLRILVAEDNATNRQLLKRLLEKRGHQVIAVADGRAAVDALTSGTVAADVVLMDVQMPRMNGLEATAAIRQHERERGQHVPIVALTAHALTGDRQRCLEAGMDGYLSKPIDADELFEGVETLAGSSRTRAQPSPPSGREKARVFDEQAALAHVGGDRRLLTEVVRLFQADYPRLYGRAERAIASGDGEGLRTASHALKGLLATVGAIEGRDAAVALETMARSGDLSGAKAGAERLKRALAEFERALRSAKLSSSASAPRKPHARPRRRPALRAGTTHAKDPHRRR